MVTWGTCLPGGSTVSGGEQLGHVVRSDAVGESGRDSHGSRRGERVGAARGASSNAERSGRARHGGNVQLLERGAEVGSPGACWTGHNTVLVASVASDYYFTHS